VVDRVNDKKKKGKKNVKLFKESNDVVGDVRDKRLQMLMKTLDIV
jgi:hypothetical protein